MSKTIKLLKAVLNLFEGGEAPAGATGETAPAAGEQTGEPNVPQQSDADSAAERTKAYDDFIKQNKDLDDARIQKLVKGRLKGANDQIQSLQQQNDAYQPLMDRLQTKYGTNDLGQIINAMDSDTALWEAEADKMGMTTDQYMKFQKLQIDNAQLIREEQARAEQMQRQQQINGWMQEAQQIQQSYPGFDLIAELENPQFASLLNAHVPMEHAFKVVHLDDITSGIARNTAAQTEKAVTDNIRAKGSRPAENGTMGQSAFTTTTDVNNLTPQDMDDLIRRAAQGEIITLRQG